MTDTRLLSLLENITNARTEIDRAITWARVLNLHVIGEDLYARKAELNRMRQHVNDLRLALAGGSVRPIDTTSDAPALTVLAEMLGYVVDPTPEQVTAVLGLLRHDKPYVREGAVLGLAEHTSIRRVREALETVSEQDADETVREVAKEMLEP